MEIVFGKQNISFTILLFMRPFYVQVIIPLMTLVILDFSDFIYNPRDSTFMEHFGTKTDPSLTNIITIKDLRGV